MLTEKQEAWLKALESGEYAQGRDVLARLHDDGVCRFCCLGVAEDLLVKAGVAEWQPAINSHGTGDRAIKVGQTEVVSYMAPYHCSEFGLRSAAGNFDSNAIKLDDTALLEIFDSDGRVDWAKRFVLIRAPKEDGEYWRVAGDTLAALNDRRWTFAELARFIRKYPNYVFRQSPAEGE